MLQTRVSQPRLRDFHAANKLSGAARRAARVRSRRQAHAH